MGKLFFSLMLCSLSLTVLSQTSDPKYCAGVVPFVDGKVIFTEILAEEAAADQLYQRAKIAMILH